MNPETNDLTLDLERCHKIQQLTDLLEQLMAAENRPAMDYVQIRHILLNAADRLGEASAAYLKLIEERQRKPD